jgi:anti-sigma regulatory factor (Ser/Thr protein kinase)
VDEVMTISRQVIEYCEEKGIDKKRAFFSGLCMEEMAGNIVTHGFSKDSKKHSVDIRVIHKGDEIILRLRDNCKAFDPATREKVMEADDMGRNVGIRLVYRIAKDVSYQNLLGLNVLTIRM